MVFTIPQVVASGSWALSEALGIWAALTAGAKSGAVGELPFSDLLLGMSRDQATNGESGENVFFGVESRWSQMMLKSFQARRLKFSYFLLQPDNPFRCGCFGCRSVLKPNTHIEPNMFFGMIPNDAMEGDSKEVIVHKPDCILQLRIDRRATEFLPKGMYDKIHKLSNGDALKLCLSIISSMSDVLCECKQANYWDKRIIVRIQKLIETISNQVISNQETPRLKETITKSDFMLNKNIQALLDGCDGEVYYTEGDLDNVNVMNEVMDRISSRVPGMLERLELTTFKVGNDTYSIPDLERAFIICFGILRAMLMSNHIYNGKGLVAMGYNINVAHELVQDVSQTPAHDTSYSSRLVIESSTKRRLIDTYIDDSHVFFGLLLDFFLSSSIMLLSGIGPILSMYAARLLTAPYRESTMRMGTSMSWAVSRAMLYNTGEARDDWMACILPHKEKGWDRMTWFNTLNILSSFGPILLWIFHHPPTSTISSMGWLIISSSMALGIVWLQSVKSMERQKFLEKSKAEQEMILSNKGVFNVAHVCAASVLFPLVLFSMNNNWVWLYLLEAIYTLQWLFGEMTSEWIHKSTALFMLGMLSAVRLCDLS
ncbi:hypothetical protein O0I10_010749 [Lichtheimia ornata]|uniref:Uncharacterized protein n=1 Tax=Lichtheimia ornata TaxID=688661 RepID=A0AAD7XR20_9FUNG|nr:uncharacterized protein O0I10_010749 [Lichtheimia ornata]KAJ8653599.1 hypothetical protein O0I10_010749 [Lichtheimia ornata]